ncbi:hypothetical protein HZB78_00330 [Candidatus Collierbacteria bacterium]|nr:hypothetical protein [Candidatus Collierbacteria bacterium]
MSVRECKAKMCSVTESLLQDWTGYFHCLATAGPVVFNRCPDCLAGTLLAELGQSVETLAELRDGISLLKKPAHPSFNEGHDGMILSG